MPEEEQVITEGQIREAISRRASVDQSFRTALKENPKETIEAFIGVALPDDKEIIVVENGPNLSHVVIPEFNDELTDDQLEAVAGGNMFDQWFGRGPTSGGMVSDIDFGSMRGSDLGAWGVPLPEDFNKEDG